MSSSLASGSNAPASTGPVVLDPAQAVVADGRVGRRGSHHDASILACQLSACGAPVTTRRQGNPERRSGAVSPVTQSPVVVTDKVLTSITEGRSSGVGGSYAARLPVMASRSPSSSPSSLAMRSRNWPSCSAVSLPCASIRLRRSSPLAVDALSLTVDSFVDVFAEQPQLRSQAPERCPDGDQDRDPGAYYGPSRGVHLGLFSVSLAFAVNGSQSFSQLRIGVRALLSVPSPLRGAVSS